MTIIEARCKECKKDWTKCGTCLVMMQWVKENRQEPQERSDKE